jgi:hypothetical protein
MREVDATSRYLLAFGRWMGRFWTRTVGLVGPMRYVLEGLGADVSVLVPSTWASVDFGSVWWRFEGVMPASANGEVLRFAGGWQANDTPTPPGWYPDPPLTWFGRGFPPVRIFVWYCHRKPMYCTIEYSSRQLQVPINFEDWTQFTQHSAVVSRYLKFQGYEE